MEEERTYTPAEVAERYKVQVTTVWSWLRSGKLDAVKIGKKRYRVRAADIQKFEDSHSI